jgi:uncharacterized membrane protein YedE/YeeE
VVERGFCATGWLVVTGAREELGGAGGVGAAVATGVVSAGLAATGVLLTQAAVQSKPAIPKRVRALCFMMSSNLILPVTLLRGLSNNPVETVFPHPAGPLD